PALGVPTVMFSGPSEMLVALLSTRLAVTLVVLTPAVPSSSAAGTVVVTPVALTATTNAFVLTLKLLNVDCGPRSVATRGLYWNETVQVPPGVNAACPLQSPP